MGNFALQKGPCNFLKLRISPWGNLFLLLLCFFSPSCLYPFLFHRRQHQSSFPLSLLPPLAQLQALLAAGGGALLPRAAARRAGAGATRREQRERGWRREPAQAWSGLERAGRGRAEASSAAGGAHASGSGAAGGRAWARLGLGRRLA
jgi:hypothetical protein